MISVLSCAFAIGAYGQNMVENSQNPSASNQASNSDQENSQSRAVSQQASSVSLQGEGAGIYRQMNKALLRQKLSGAPLVVSEPAFQGLQRSSVIPTMNSLSKAGTNPEKKSIAVAPNSSSMTAAKPASSFSGKQSKNRIFESVGGPSNISSISSLQSSLPSSHSIANSPRTIKAESNANRLGLASRRRTQKKSGLGLMRSLSPHMSKKASAVKQQHSGLANRLER